MTDGIITALCYISEAVMLVALLYCRAWRTVPVLFWVQMFEAGELIASDYITSTQSFTLFYDVLKVNALLSLITFFFYILRKDLFHLVALFSLLDSTLIFWQFSGVDAEILMIPTIISYEECAVNVFMGLLIAAAVYDTCGANPHPEVR